MHTEQIEGQQILVKANLPLKTDCTKEMDLSLEFRTVPPKPKCEDLFFSIARFRKLRAFSVPLMRFTKSQNSRMLSEAGSP